jgi:hypothetical protein
MFINERMADFYYTVSLMAERLLLVLALFAFLILFTLSKPLAGLVVLIGTGVYYLKRDRLVPLRI